MRMYFKQRLFSWFDSYDIYDENDNVLYRVEGQLALGHLLYICDAAGNHLGTVKERIFTFLPQFEMYEGEQFIGSIAREFSFLIPRYTINCFDWHVSGDMMQWDYEILDHYDHLIASVSKDLFHLTDQYVIEVENPANQLYALMFVLAVDAEKCSRK